ncbi:MAG: DNA primase small subunit domain-containing protein [archaeon]
MVEVKNIAPTYYSRKDIQEAIFKFSKHRETIPRYIDSQGNDGFGKRPDTLEYPSDIIAHVKKGATSFHCSEELWTDPLQISTSLSLDQLNELRFGWDLLIDIDSKYLDYSKISAELIIEALSFHGVKNVGIKFSGSKGFHLIIPWKAFPQEIHGQSTGQMFPEWPRIISLYLTDIIKPKLSEKIAALTMREKKSYVRDFEAHKKVMPDIILVSSRHLFRAPYSLHEKTKLASIVIDSSELANFEPRMAHPLKVKLRDFYPQAEEQEARELLMQSLDWYQEKHKKQDKPRNVKFQKVEVDKSSVVYPPSIKKILQGMEDGRKRALFILINYFRSLDFTQEEIEAKITEWNKKNKIPLKEGYIKSQLQWTFRQKQILPPNYDKDFYKGIGITPDESEMKMKNPVNYTIKKSKWKNK